MRTTFAKFAMGILIAGAAIMPWDQAKASDDIAVAEALERRSKEADSPKEHAQLAKEYRLRAEDLEKKAAKHQATANKLRGPNAPLNPMAHKWPAMANGGWQREEQLAMQARRAAEECREQAVKHLSLAVEGQLAP